MAVDPRQLPGRIPAINMSNGVPCRVRPDMFDMHDSPFKRISEKEFLELSFPEGLPERYQEKPSGSTAAPSLAPNVPKEDGLPHMLLTKANVPFKTEAAARTAMTANKLPVEEYDILPVDDGFIVTRK